MHIFVSVIYMVAKELLHAVLNHLTKKIQTSCKLFSTNLVMFTGYSQIQPASLLFGIKYIAVVLKQRFGYFSAFYF